jgi:hypothetical protein
MTSSPTIDIDLLPPLNRREAAVMAGMDERLFKKHVDAGDVLYIIIGQATKKYLVKDVLAFREELRQQTCPSTNHKNRKSGTTISNSRIIDITDLLDARKK